jgi:hypothetical protein
MKNKFILLGVSIIMIVAFLCGCQEEAVTTKDQFKNITLESTIVELVNGSLAFHTKQDFTDDFEPIELVDQVDVQYRLHNIAKRAINVNVTLEFYDRNDALIASINGPTINNFLDDYTERLANTVTYNGAKVAEVDHVKIIVFET